jgi:NAD(P)-dependent dehydrogenase (short-subunit alcohol dehydrogenase family)
MSTRKIAIVTGAGTGVGKSAALALSKAGWTVVLAGRREQHLKDVQSACAHPAHCLVVPTDVADPASVERLFDAVVKHHGRVDLLFNNAGVSAPGVPLDE